MTDAWVGLGANLGARRATLSEALRQLGRVPGVRIERISSLYESPAESLPGLPASAPPFLNAVALLRTALAPRALLWHLLRIEAKLGRRRQERTIGRTLDLDLLAAGDAVIHEADLQLPHPRLSGRAFVVRPLLELAPEWRLPGGGGRLCDAPGASAPGCVRLSGPADDEPGGGWPPHGLPGAR